MLEAQKLVRQFVEFHGLGISANVRLMDLVSEVGELAKEMVEISEYGETEFRPTVRWGEEMGDAFFSLLCLANATGVDLDEVLGAAIVRYEERWTGSE